MKYKTLNEMNEKDIWELKDYLLRLVSDYQMNEYEKVILFAIDEYELRKMIMNNQYLEKKVFIDLKKKVAASENGIDMENYLIYMKKLLNWEYVPYQQYRNDLLKSLDAMAKPYFTADLYCLMRHIVKVNSFNLQYILNQHVKKMDEYQKYFLSEIYMIEENYNKAYAYLKECTYVGALCEYDSELYHYSPLKYRLYAKKQPLFNFKAGEHLWMRKQLKF